MCHMFLVPVFETGSLRTFTLSTHTNSEKAAGKEDRQRGIQRVRRMEGMRGRWLKMDGWVRLSPGWRRL